MPTNARSRSRGGEHGRVRSWSRERATAAKKGEQRKAAQQVATVKTARKDIFARELGYQDASNPFGDQTLTEKFVWKKKNEYLSAAGLYRKTSKDQSIERIESKVREIHQVKKRRDEREVERILLEKQRQDHDKERHDELYDTWVKSEEQFHIDAAKTRSLVRIEQGRERPIDLVAKELAIAEGEEFEDMTILDKPPHQLFLEAGLAEAEEMFGEIEMFVKNDLPHKHFWKAMLYACNDAVETKQREKTAGRTAALCGMGAGVAEGVVAEIHELLSSKDRKELEDMMIEIKQTLGSADASVDTQFFDAVSAKIPLYMARAEIEEWHFKAQLRRDSVMQALERGELDAGGQAKGDWDDLPGAEKPQKSAAAASSSAAAAADDSSGDEAAGGLSPELEPITILEQRGQGCCSPVLEPLNAYDDEDLLDPDEDERILRQVRNTLVEAFRTDDGPSGSGDHSLDRSRDDALLAAEKSKGFGDGEVGFNAAGKGAGDDFHGEISLPAKHYEWEDKYKPRKPRFFNRVKAGYEWNKYNQTHYDHDNPPPKMVQGYKFNIFYPDLIDKVKAPIYYVEKDKNDDETVTLRFHAGPPYEDVAFKIVNREWNLSHKFGFRVVFDRGVLQLYFNFKRWRYRR